jgi:hypothetical protein
MGLLNFDANTKTVKGQKSGILTGILYLAPSIESGINVCPNSSDGCAKACLYTAGRGRFQQVKDARIKKTKALFENKSAFIATLEKEIGLAVKRAAKKGFDLAIRLNGTSDLAIETWGLMQKFPKVQFYDYTKGPQRMGRYLDGLMPKNYHLTFSLSETNKEKALGILHKGGNVAIVFNTQDPNAFPKTYWGFKVINGDTDDLRFLDPVNVIVALKMKGRALWDKVGFVQPVIEQVENVSLAA